MCCDSYTLYETVPVWGLEVVLEEKEKWERCDERLVLRSGWLYKQDIQLSHLGKEKTVVGSHLDVVDDVSFE